MSVKGAYTYDYARPALTVDVVLFGWTGERLEVLLIERGGEPFAGCWALPGGFVDMHESLETAALRELQEETEVGDVYLEQLYTFGAPGRDPRGRVVSVAWYALVSADAHVPHAASDASDAAWHPVNALPPLAFDHAQIVSVATDRLRAKVRYAPVGFELLPERFTLSQLQELYEALLGRPLDKRNFRKKIAKLGVLEELDVYEQGVAHRPSRLHAFRKDRYEALTASGWEFDL
ncbi:MAG: NUDIX domain-containing protein [Myxococcota bacterium]